MPVDDPLDELASSVSDGSEVNWAEAESSAQASGQEESVRALRDLARIADFNRALQRPVGAGAPMAPPAGAAAAHPAHWGHFTLLEQIGAGANGEVWRAWDASLHREVAVKFLQERDREAEGKGQTALLDEARAVARVRHPSVVAVYGIAEHEGRAGMWMEFLRGATLAAEIERRGALEPSEVARIGAQLCAALEAIDHAGLVHRDIKPSNVVLEADGRAVLTDFGLGWRLTFLPTQSPRRGSGTPLFMAPSLLAGGSPTPRTDLYALGVTLRWALTGRAPFHARSLEELKEQAARGPDRPLAEERPEAPAALVEAIERAMREGPETPAYHAARMRALLQGVVGERAEAVAAPSGVPRSAYGPGGDRPSIAVLPFLNRGRDDSDEYFSDGLADEMLNVLSKVRGLHVAARTSSFQFKGKHEDLETIGRKLNVATVLEGSVRMGGDRVRIAVRLVRVAGGEQLWSETYDRALDDIFAVQDDIARCVVEELRAALLPTPARQAAGTDVRAEVAAAVKGRGHDPEAYRRFLQGRHHAYLRTPDDVAKAVALLRESVERDPSYAIAWSELGNCYASQGDFGTIPAAEGQARAREAIARALALEPDLPEGHARLARMQAAYDQDWRAAEASFRKALAGDPGNAVALHGAGILAQGLGRSEEAIELTRRAIAVDPLSAGGHNNLAAILYESGRLEEAEASFRTALELAPHRYGTRSFLAQVLAELGRFDEALAEAAREPDDVFRLLALVILHHRAGRAAESAAAMADLAARHGANSPAQVAEGYGARGEVDAAFEWLERARAERDAGVVHIKPSPHFRALRDDPRWPVFLAKLGLAG